jgi:hypothetical protein
MRAICRRCVPLTSVPFSVDAIFVVLVGVVDAICTSVLHVGAICRRCHFRRRPRRCHLPSMQFLPMPFAIDAIFVDVLVGVVHVIVIVIVFLMSSSSCRRPYVVVLSSQLLLPL